MAKVKWGLVGFGEQVKKRMLPALQKTKDVEITAICCSSPERAKAVEDELGIAGYGKLSEFLENQDINVVYIATPHHLHVPQAFKALEAGKNVLVEKPMALSVDGAHKVIEVARRKSLLLGVNFPLRHHPGLRELREELEQGKLGELVHLFIHLSRRRYQGEGWWRDQFHAGPMALMDLGVQGIDLALWLIAERAVEVFTLGRGGKDDESLNTAVAIAFNFENGTQAMISSSNMASGDSNLLFVQGTEKQVIIEMNWPDGDGSFRIRYRRGGEEAEKTYPPIDLYQMTVEKFTQAVLGKTRYSPDGTDAYPVVEASCSAIESLKSSRTIKIGEILRVTGSRYKE